MTLRAIPEVERHVMPRSAEPCSDTASMARNQRRQWHNRPDTDGRDRWADRCAPRSSSAPRSMRSRSRLVALRVRARAVLAGADLGNQALYLFLVPAVLVAGVSADWGRACSRPRSAWCSAPLFVTGEFATLIAAGDRRTSSACSRAIGFGMLGSASLVAAKPRCATAARPRRARPRGAPPIDPRHRAGRDDRDRRARHHPVVQLGRRAPVRLYGRARCSARTSRC